MSRIAGTSGKTLVVEGAVTLSNGSLYSNHTYKGEISVASLWLIDHTLSSTSEDFSDAVEVSTAIEEGASYEVAVGYESGQITYQLYKVA